MTGRPDPVEEHLPERGVSGLRLLDRHMPWPLQRVVLIQGLSERRGESRTRVLGEVRAGPAPLSPSGTPGLSAGGLFGTVVSSHRSAEASMRSDLSQAALAAPFELE